MKAAWDRFILWMAGEKMDKIRAAHLLQSGLAALYMLAVFFLMSAMDGVLLFPSLAATVFIVFAFPKAKSSRPRFIIGGYVLAGLWGVLASLTAQGLSRQLELPFDPVIPICALTVFVVMLFMACFNFEHPPACAMAVTLVLIPNPIPTALSALASVVVLLCIKHLLRNHLQNL